MTLQRELALVLGPDPVKPGAEPDPEVVAELAEVWAEHREQLIDDFGDPWGLVFDGPGDPVAAWPRFVEVS
jgi:hypothetical protein